MGEMRTEKKQILEHMFKQYDTERKGELGPVQLQILHGDIRMGGISIPQVMASIKYVCVGNVCTVSELFDLLQEMDRRYFLLQDLRWEFSLLDREGKNSINVEQAKWLVQAVHGNYFSRCKWDQFLKSRAVPGSDVGFVDIEVMLCDILSRTEAEEEQRQIEKEEGEKRRRRAEYEEAERKERERKQKLEEEQRKREQNRKQKEDTDQRKSEQRKIEEERRKRREEEELRRKKEDEERLRQEREEAEVKLRKLREEEEQKYRDAEKLMDEAERAEKEAEEHLKKVRQQKAGAEGKRRADLEIEEKTLQDSVRHSRHKRIRYQLKVAVKTRDKTQLKDSIAQFTKEELSDDDMDLARAQKLLKEINAKEGLHKALSKREIQQLEQAMAYVRKHGFESELTLEMMAASKLLGRLHRMEHIRHEILDLKQSTVAEIRSYQNPPPVVHSVMTAVFLMLGHTEKETKVYDYHKQVQADSLMHSKEKVLEKLKEDWKAVQALVGKTGKESLKRRCLELKSESLSVTIVKRAKMLLGKFELDEVRDISAGAATFHVWATAIIEDVLEREEEKTAA